MIQIIAAGILLLPAALVIVVTLPVVAILSIPALYFLLYRAAPASKAAAAALPPPQQRRAIITGGSSGIGLAIAHECVQRGFAEVIILARNVDKLTAAKEALQETAATKRAHNNNDNNSSVTFIEALSVNVTDSQALVKAASKIFAPKSAATKEKDDDTTDRSGSTTAATATSCSSSSSSSSSLSTYLFCCAGETHPTYFEDLTCEQFANICATNQLGSIYTVHAMLPHMKTKQNNGGGGGAICFCSSMAGQVGIFGYTAYCPTKFAIRGFAEALHMELCSPSSSSSSSSSSCESRPIHVCVAYPPDTETPCYAKENITKPMETRLISEDGGLCQPQHVARIMVDQVTERRIPPFAISFNFDGWMLSCLTAGFSPVTGLVDAVAQVAAGALFRIVSLFYLQQWWYTIRKYRQSKQEGKAKEAKEQNSHSSTTEKEKETKTK